jgi:anaerobic ribonucleoside-triphosphate reductase
MNIRKGWYTKHSFTNDFVNYLEGLYKKYGEEIFSIQGIANRHMDIVDYSREFFNKSGGNVADTSVDANANVKEKHIAQYNHENNKSLMKLNSLYLMYKYVNKYFDEKSAQMALDKVVSGEIFINDLNSLHQPYSYYGQTPIIVRINGKVQYVTMQKLFSMFDDHSEDLGHMERIKTCNLGKEIKYYDILPSNFGQSSKKKHKRGHNLAQYPEQKYNIEVFDISSKTNWTNVSQIIRHSASRDMVLYQLENGNFAFVTDDHPIYMNDLSEKQAIDLKVGDTVLEGQLSPKVDNNIVVPDSLAYSVGFILGDGNMPRFKAYKDSINSDHVAIKVDPVRHTTYIYQKDPTKHNIYKHLSVALNKEPTIYGDRKLMFSCPEFTALCAEYFGLNENDHSFNKTLPINILNWNISSQDALIAGLIDSDGTVHKTGLCDIRLKSVAIIQQLADVLRSRNIECRTRICELSESGYTNQTFPYMFGLSFRPTEYMFNMSEKYTNKFDCYNDIPVKNPNMDTTSNKFIVSKIYNIKMTDEFQDYCRGCMDDVYDITTDTGKFYANGMTQHNCYAFDLRSLLMYGMNFFKGNMNIKPPKRSDSFVDLVIQSTAFISNQLVGACSYPDFFAILNMFYEKENGNKYINDLKTGRSLSSVLKDKDITVDNIKEIKEILKSQSKSSWCGKLWVKLQDERRSDVIIFKINNLLELWYKVKNQFQNIIYSFNFPFRGGQSAFINLSVMDKGFMQGLFSDYVYPDMTKPNILNIIEISKIFYEYFADINCKEGIFTFPVMTHAISLDENGEYIDPGFAKWSAKANCEKSLANIFQDSPTSFSSCCRLKNDYSKVSDAGFQNSFGVGGLSIGSVRVCGVNLPRIGMLEKKGKTDVLDEALDTVHKVLYAQRQLIKERIEGGMLPLYDTNWIHVNKQYSTVGFIGAYEYIKNLGLSIKNKNGISKLQSTLKKIERKIVTWQKDEAKEHNIYNIEQIPGESMSVRLAEIDKILGYNKDEVLYSNQYIPLIEDASIYDRMKIQGEFDKQTSGGSILHLNVDDEKPINKDHFYNIMQEARKLGVSYYAINYAYSECENGHFVIGKHDSCPICEHELQELKDELEKVKEQENNE